MSLCMTCMPYKLKNAITILLPCVDRDGKFSIMQVLTDGISPITCYYIGKFRKTKYISQCNYLGNYVPKICITSV